MYQFLCLNEECQFVEEAETTSNEENWKCSVCHSDTLPWRSIANAPQRRTQGPFTRGQFGIDSSVVELMLAYEKDKR